MTDEAKSDSINILAENDFFILGFDEDDPFGKRMVHLTQVVIRHCTFEEQEKLLKHKNRYIGLYAFIGLCEYHFHKITDEHKKIMKSKLPISMYSKGGNQPYETIGYMAKMMYDITKEMLTTEAIYKPKLEVAIKSLILKFALYPESYYPILFEYFLYNDSHLTINHTYILKNSSANLDTAKHVFVTDLDYIIQAISMDPYSNDGTISANPAKIDEWLKLYARPIYKQDSIELNLIRQW